MNKPKLRATLTEYQVKGASFSAHFVCEYYGKKWDGSEHYRLLTYLATIDRRKPAKKPNGYLEFYTDVFCYSGKAPSETFMGKVFRDDLHRALTHEADECFHINEKRPFNPHKRKAKRR